MRHFLPLLALALLGVCPSPAGAVGEFGVGRDGACRLVPGQPVVCWGGGGTWLGPLGKPGATVGPGGASSPAPVAGTEASRDLAVGGDTACVIAGDRAQVSCWGVRQPFPDAAETLAEAGHAAPEPVPWVEGAREIVTTEEATCVVVRGGKVSCWGTVRGIGSTDEPRTIKRLSGVRRLALAGHGCALTGTGAVFCWGYNDDHDVSSSKRQEIFTPTRVNGLPPARDVAVHAGGSCALVKGGELWCWGRGGLNPSAKPARVPVPPATGLAMGGERTCVVGRDKLLRCWGSRARKALGISTGTKLVPPDSSISIEPKYAVQPVQPLRNKRVGSVWLGLDATCAETIEGQQWCWGAASVSTPLLPRTASWKEDSYGRPVDTAIPRRVS